MSISDAEIKEILQETRRIAIVGLSNKPDRDSYKVAKYLQEAGFTIIPINPVVDEVLGIKAVPSLLQLTEPVDLIDVFRRSEETVSIAEQSVKTGAKVLWLQLGIKNEEAERIAREAGMKVVMDRCIKIEHERLLGKKG
ncbi:MAG: CoA-binding protein [Thermicanus sp.]|nr:CoA-binding protein [Thermicanus sp.]